MRHCYCFSPALECAIMKVQENENKNEWEMLASQLFGWSLFIGSKHNYREKQWTLLDVSMEDGL